MERGAGGGEQVCLEHLRTLVSFYAFYHSLGVCNTRIGGQKSDFCLLRVFWQVWSQLSCLRGIFPSPRPNQGCCIHCTQLRSKPWLRSQSKWLQGSLSQQWGRPKGAASQGGAICLSAGDVWRGWVLSLFSRQVTLEFDKHRKVTYIRQLPAPFCF